MMTRRKDVTSNSKGSPSPARRVAARNARRRTIVQRYADATVLTPMTQQRTVEESAACLRVRVRASTRGRARRSEVESERAGRQCLNAFR